MVASAEATLGAFEPEPSRVPASGAGGGVDADSGAEPPAQDELLQAFLTTARAPVSAATPEPDASFGPHRPRAGAPAQLEGFVPEFMRHWKTKMSMDAQLNLLLQFRHDDPDDGRAAVVHHPGDRDLSRHVCPCHVARCAHVV
ncbi:hypothetical protein [Flindersiella endophytica]